MYIKLFKNFYMDHLQDPNMLHTNGRHLLTDRKYNIHYHLHHSHFWTRWEQKGFKPNGTFLYYARAVDPYMLLAIDDVSSQQVRSIEDTNNKAAMLMDYTHTYRSVTLIYHTSNM